MLVFTSDPAHNLYIRLHWSLFGYIGKINYINHLLAAPELTREHSAIFSVKHKKMHIF